jgi:hypothetical protein
MLGLYWIIAGDWTSINLACLGVVSPSDHDHKPLHLQIFLSRIKTMTSLTLVTKGSWSRRKETTTPLQL